MEVVQEGVRLLLFACPLESQCFSPLLHLGVWGHPQKVF